MFLKEGYLPKCVITIDDKKFIVDDNITNDDFMMLISEGYSWIFDFTKRLSEKKVCSICKQELKLTQFHNKSINCINCSKKKRRERRKK